MEPIISSDISFFRTAYSEERPCETVSAKGLVCSFDIGHMAIKPCFTTSPLRFSPAAVIYMGRFSMAASLCKNEKSGSGKINIFDPVNSAIGTLLAA